MIGHTALCLEKFGLILAEDGRYKEKLTNLLQMVEEYSPK